MKPSYIGLRNTEDGSLMSVEVYIAYVESPEVLVIKLALQKCHARKSDTRPANLENVFRGTFRIKKAGLAGKKRDGWLGPH